MAQQDFSVTIGRGEITDTGLGYAGGTYDPFGAISPSSFEGIPIDSFYTHVSSEIYFTFRIPSSFFDISKMSEHSIVVDGISYEIEDMDSDFLQLEDGSENIAWRRYMENNEGNTVTLSIIYPDPLVLPTPVTDFNATDNEEGQVTCTWTASPDATSEDIYRDDALLASGVTSPYVDTTSDNGVQYNYKIVSNNDTGSDDSNIDIGAAVCKGTVLRHYKFEDNLNSECGVAPLEWIGTEQYGGGMFGQAAKIVEGDYINVPLIEHPNNEFSICLWFNYTQRNADNQFIVSISDEINTKHFGLRIDKNTNNISFLLNNAAQNLPTIFELNTWYHIVIDTNGNAYVDGIHVFNHQETSYIINPFLNLCLGARGTETSITYDGFIDEFYIINKIVTAEDVEKLYNGVYPGLPPLIRFGSLTPNNFMFGDKQIICVYMGDYQVMCPTPIVPEAPSVITDLDASDDREDGVVILWTNATGYPTPTYELFRDTVSIATNISGGYFDDTTALNTTYEYYITATNSEGSVDSNKDDGIMIGEAVPEAPSVIMDFDASDNRTDGVKVTWTNATGHPTPMYNLTRDTVEIKQTISSGYIDDTAVIDTVYNYYVTAINSEGSIDSNSNTGKMLDDSQLSPPSAIVNLAATDNRKNDIVITWADSTGVPEPTYILFRDDIEISNNAVSGHTDSSVVQEQTYTYYVIAINSEGNESSNTDTGKATSAEAPSVIVDFTATDTLPNDIVCTWSPASGTPTPTYTLYRNGVVVDNNATSPHFDAAPAANINYIYYVEAKNVNGTTSSNTDPGKMVRELPEAITDFNATDNLTELVNCTWTMSPNADSHNVFRDSVMVGLDVSSPYPITVVGTNMYHVEAVNLQGTTIGNSDSGTGLEEAEDPSGYIEYYTAGSYTFTVPVDVYEIRTCMMGGGGGGSVGATAFGHAGGGHAGSTAAPNMVVTPGDTFVAVIGHGGLGHDNMSAGNGGDAFEHTTFLGNTAYGGLGGTADAADYQGDSACRDTGCTHTSCDGAWTDGDGTFNAWGGEAGYGPGADGGGGANGLGGSGGGGSKVGWSNGGDGGDGYVLVYWGYWGLKMYELDKKNGTLLSQQYWKKNNMI